jgi:hypothetical protein
VKVGSLLGIGRSGMATPEYSMLLIVMMLISVFSSIAMMSPINTSVFGQYVSSIWMALLVTTIHVGFYRYKFRNE